MITNVTKYLIDNHILRSKKEVAKATLAGNVYIDEFKCLDPNYCLGEAKELSHKIFGDVVSIYKKSDNEKLIDLFRSNISVDVETEISKGYYGPETDVYVKVYFGGVLVYEEKSTH